MDSVMVEFVREKLRTIEAKIDHLTAAVEMLAPAKETDNQVFTRTWAKWTAKEPSEPTPVPEPAKEPPRTCGDCAVRPGPVVSSWFCKGEPRTYLSQACPDLQSREATP